MSSVDRIPHLDDQVCFALYSASRSLTAHYREPLTRFNLTYPQYLTLMALWETDNQSLKELGTKLRLDSGTLSPLLRRLEAQEYVVRRRAQDDERRMVISLTDAGRKVGEQAYEIQMGLACDSGLSLEELKTLRTLATKIATANSEQN